MADYVLPLSKTICFCRDDFYDELKEVQRLGYEYVDFDVASKWSRPREERKRYADLEKGLEAVRKAGLKINGVHISFGPKWDPSDKWNFRRKKIVKKIVEVIKRTEAGDPFCYILHGSFEPIIGERDREKHIDALLSSLPDICAATKKYVCIETLPRTCLFNTAAESLSILERANIDNLRICLDTNHFLQEKTEDAVLALAGKIATLHVSDHDYINERHWLPGKGKIDWNAVLAALQKTGYHGAFNYEVEESAEIVKNNHHDLFAAYNAAYNKENNN